MASHKLSAKEGARRRRLGLCMYCGGGDHQVDDCAKLQAKEQQRAIAAMYRRDPPKLASLVPKVEVKVKVGKSERSAYEYQSIKQWLQEDGLDTSPADQPPPQLVPLDSTVTLTDRPRENAAESAQFNHVKKSQSMRTKVFERGEQPRGLFALPRELRDTIYFGTIRPDCRLQFKNMCNLQHECVIDVGGCTNLFLLSSQVYCESIEVLHAHENLIMIKSNRAPLFKSMKDFPYPSVFKSSKYGFTPYLPTGFCELHLLRFRKLAIGIEMPRPVRIGPEAYPGQHGALHRLGTKLLDLSAALSKSPHLQTLRIMIKREYDGRYLGPWLLGFHRSTLKDRATSDGIDIHVKKLLRPLLEVALAKRIKISAEEHCIYREQALEGGTKMAFKPISSDPLVDWINAMTPLALRAKPACDWGETTLMQNVYQRSFDKFPDTFIEEEENRFKKTFSGIRDTAMPYELIPERRTCNALFGSGNDLKAHLDRYPKHAKKYQAKKCNEVYPSSDFGGRIKCITCAYEPEGIKKLDQHLKRSGHRRWGIVPRWKEDNMWYDERDRRRLEKKGGGPPLWVKPYYGN